jgi:hypothetical protein
VTSATSTCIPIGDTVGYTTVDQGPGLPTIGVYIAKSWTFQAGADATFNLDDGGPLPNAVALVALDTIDVEGTLDASGGGFVSFGATSPTKGAGPGGGGAGSTESSAGGGGFCGPGGTGSAFPGGTPGAGGVVYGTANLIPLVPGSAGGSTDGGMYAGGGAIQLVAGTMLLIGKTGVITAGGQGGELEDGAGSGGAILLESPMVTIDGTVAANGGGGGGEGTDGIGASGTPNATPAAGGTNGGKGSAAITIAGGDGSCPAASCMSSNMNDNPASGGGGAGRIRVNTMTGTDALTGGTHSPDFASKCMTEGKITP